MLAIRQCFLLLASVVALPLAPSQSLAEGPPTPKDVKQFETRIRPLLAERCFKCHGPSKQKGGLRLDSAQAVKRGGSSGTPLIAPANPGDSLLLRAVKHAEGVEAMPPDTKLSESEIAALTWWVQHGAFFPEKASAAQSDPAAHWSFRRVVKPKVPK